MPTQIQKGDTNTTWLRKYNIIYKKIQHGQRNIVVTIGVDRARGACTGPTECVHRACTERALCVHKDAQSVRGACTEYTPSLH